MTRDLNPWRIVDVHDGAIGWIKGKLVGAPTLLGPCSKRPCFYYSMLEEGRGAQSDGVGELVIDDGSGLAIVEIASATVQVNYDHESSNEAETVRGVVHPARHRREGILAPGEVVAVHGHCLWELDPDPARYGLYRDPLPRRLRVSGTSRVQIWVTERL